MAFTLSSEGLISLVSARAEQITGYTARELAGHPITEILTDDSIFQAPIMMNAARTSGSWEGELFYRSRAGSQVAAHAQLLMLAGPEEPAYGFMLICNLNFDENLSPDSHAVKVGKQLRAYAHEINNPLAVMMGFGQLILLNSECNGKIRTDMEKIFSELQRVIHSVEQLHDYALLLQDGRQRAGQ